MEVSFATPKLEKEFNNEKELIRNRNKIQATFIKRRLNVMHAADSLEALRNAPGHFHALTADKAGYLACDLDGPNRLIFEPDHEPLPAMPYGGLDWEHVTKVKILGVQDYHERNKTKPV